MVAQLAKATSKTSLHAPYKYPRIVNSAHGVIGPSVAKSVVLAREIVRDISLPKLLSAAKIARRDWTRLGLVIWVHAAKIAIASGLIGHLGADALAAAAVASEHATGLFKSPRSAMVHCAKLAPGPRSSLATTIRALIRCASMERGASGANGANAQPRVAVVCNGVPGRLQARQTSVEFQFSATTSGFRLAILRLALWTRIAFWKIGPFGVHVLALQMV